MVPQFSPPDAIVRANEENAFIYFLDFVDECEGMCVAMMQLSRYLHSCIASYVFWLNNS